MEVRGKISRGALRSIVEALFFSSLFALPWINLIHVSTFMFIIMACLMLFTSSLFINYTWFKKQILFLLFFIYYIFQVTPFFIHAHEVYLIADIEKKTSWIAIPLLLYVLISKYNDIWRTGIIGFIWGNVVAAICCLITAAIKFNLSKNISVFFYHQYAHVIGLSAIYFSLYLLIALGYIILQIDSFKRKALVKIIAFFLYANILLLSSKIMIVAGTLLLIAPVLKLIPSSIYKLAALSMLISICALLACTENPIKKRYTEINIHNYTPVLHKYDFTNFQFDGLSLRLLLWRLGNEVVNEKRTWLLGAGGDRYHQLLNDKMKQYRIYSGNTGSVNKGYQNYNMHNQYMESYVQTGIVGILSLIAMLVCILYYSICNDNPFMIYMIALFSIVFLTESVLETQSGILLFTIITSGEWIQSQKKKAGILS